MRARYGRLTSAQLAYDAERRLTHYQNIPGASPDVEAWYLYDGAGNRVEQAVKQSGVTTSTYYLAGGVEEVRSDGSLIKYYGSLGLNTGATASTIAYLASDGLGSLQVTLNSSGSATALQLHAAYGAVRYTNGVFPTSKGFTGQRSDAAISGLDYYGARYYDPRLGQFTSADSVLDGINRYAYVGGNPETKTDPSGHGQRVGVPQAFAPPGNYGFSIDLSGLGSAIEGLLAATAGAGIAALTHSPAQQGHIVTANGHWAIYSNTSPAAIAGPTSWMTTINQADLVGHRHINVPTTQVPTTVTPPHTGNPPSVSVPRSSGGVPITRPIGHPGGISVPSFSLPAFDFQVPAGGYSNLRPERLGAELSAVGRLLRAYDPSQKAFADYVEQGVPLIWAVDMTGMLWVLPSIWNGRVINHPALTRGANVLAAGEAIIESADGGYVGVEINNQSGHYQPGPEAIQIGIEAFKEQFGIEFPTP